MFLIFITISVFVYLAGAIPIGYLVCKAFYGSDITELGSGNIGATNVARIKGKFLFLPIFLIDAGKAYLTLYLANLVWNNFYGYHSLSWFIFAMAGILLLGNAYSVFIGFKGGKGVATTLGIIAYTISVTCFLMFAALWLVIFVVTKRAFVASIGAMFLFLCGALLLSNFGNDNIFFLTCLLLWLLFRHQSNFKKLI